MANQYWLSQLMDMNELLHVVGHGSIIMSRVMGGVTMISEVLCCTHLFQSSEPVFRQNIRTRA